MQEHLVAKQEETWQEMSLYLAYIYIFSMM
jgi:hypothetical protein